MKRRNQKNDSSEKEHSEIGTLLKKKHLNKDNSDLEKDSFENKHTVLKRTNLKKDNSAEDKSEK